MRAVCVAEMRSELRRHKLPMADDYRKMKATGIAFCHEGRLTLCPAAFECEFRHNYFEEILCPEAGYSEWFNRCYGDGEGEA